MSRRPEVSAPSSQRSSSRLNSNSSSSSAPADQRGSRKRPVEEVTIDDENETPNRESVAEDVIITNVARKYDVNSFLFQPNEKDVHKFEALTDAVQAQCVKAVCRLFVMKGARKETISRETIRNVLSEIDSDYKKHVAVILKRVQQQLFKSLGYVVVSSDSIVGMRNNGKSDEYYVTNNLSSPKLMKLLNQAKRFGHFNQPSSTQRNHNNSSSSSSSQPLTGRGRRESSSRPNYSEDADNASEEENEEGGGAAGGGGPGSGGTTIAFVGFLMLVCGTIYTAPQKRITCEDLLSHIRKVDPRFPTRLTSNKDSSVCPVPELEEQFLSLVKRLLKEHYLVAKKPEGGDKGEENVVYSLGPRFYLDIGRKELMLKYFQLMDQPIDECIMKEIEEDAKKEEAENGHAEEEGANNGNAATAPVAAPVAPARGGSSSSSAHPPPPDAAPTAAARNSSSSNASRRSK